MVSLTHPTYSRSMVEAPGEHGPLTVKELRIVRGMIDEYLYAQRRHAFWRATFGTSRLVITGLAALTVIILNIITLALVISH